MPDNSLHPPSSFIFTQKDIPNAADQRVYQLLDQKFKLFSGVFGASDEVLGSIESGVDFEQRIAAIYQECRKPEEIQEAFDKLQEELADGIIEKMVTSRQKLLENFDDEVAQKLRINRDLGIKRLNRFEQWLWDITRYRLAGYGDFDASAGSFKLNKNPFPGEDISTGKYQLLRQSDEHRKSETEIADDTRIYRIGHPLAKKTLKQIPSWYIEQSEIDGSDWKLMVLYDTEVEKSKVRDQKSDVKKMQDKRENEFRWLHLGEEGKKIEKILRGVNPDNEMKCLIRWSQYLEEHLNFPIKTIVDDTDDFGPVRDGDKVSIQSLPQLADLYGIIAEVRLGKSKYFMPLCELEVIDKYSTDHQLIDDYRIWFANR